MCYKRETPAASSPTIHATKLSNQQQTKSNARMLTAIIVHTVIRNSNCTSMHPTLICSSSPASLSRCTCFSFFPLFLLTPPPFAWCIGFVCYSIAHSRTSYTVPPDILDYPTSTDMVVREDSNVTLKCAATGSPEPTITWRRENGVPIELANGSEGKYHPTHMLQYTIHI